MNNILKFYNWLDKLYQNDKKYYRILFLVLTGCWIITDIIFKEDIPIITIPTCILYSAGIVYGFTAGITNAILVNKLK